MMYSPAGVPTKEDDAMGEKEINAFLLRAAELSPAIRQECSLRDAVDILQVFAHRLRKEWEQKLKTGEHDDELKELLLRWALVEKTYEEGKALFDVSMTHW